MSYPRKIAAVVILLALLILILMERRAVLVRSNESAVPAGEAQVEVGDARLSEIKEVVGEDVSATNRLLLKIVAADSGLAIPNVPLRLAITEGTNVTETLLQTSRHGLGSIYYPSNITQLEITTQVDDFADTRLRWRTNSEIPPEYLLKLRRGTRIGGRVLTDDDAPIAGATVRAYFGSAEESPARAARLEAQAIAWTAISDESGAWSLRGIPESVLAGLAASAGHPDYRGSFLYQASAGPAGQDKMLKGEYVFRLEKGVTIRGRVTDRNGAPIGGATMQLSPSNSEAVTANDGTFVLKHVAPGHTAITVEAKGFAARTIQMEAAGDETTVNFVLQPGNLLRVRVINAKGEPIPNASVSLDAVFPPTPNSRQQRFPFIRFEAKSGADGRMVWEEAPYADLLFDISASGYRRLANVLLVANGEEQVLMLPTPPIVEGTVRDAETGAPVENFEVRAGRIARIHEGTERTYWDNGSDRSFQNGTFKYALEAPALSKIESKFQFRIRADGYEDFISRAIHDSAPHAVLEVLLTRAKSVAE